MVVTIVCRDTISCKVTIVLCNGAQDTLLAKCLMTCVTTPSLPSIENYLRFKTVPPTAYFVGMQLGPGIVLVTDRDSWVRSGSGVGGFLGDLFLIHRETFVAAAQAESAEDHWTASRCCKLSAGIITLDKLGFSDSSSPSWVL